MKLKNIDIHIFKILLANKKINTTEIIKIYPENELNIKLSLSRLDNFLNNSNYGKITKDNNFYTLNLKPNKIFSKTLTSSPSLSSEERIFFLFLVLAFEQKINTCKIAEYFNITRNTLYNDIKLVKSKLAEQNLHLKSVPWKGLFLNGNKKDIYIFSIKIILKFLVEKEANQVIYNIYETLINPFFKTYYKKFISEELDYNFSKLSLQIVKYFNIEIDLYGVNTLKSIFIYLYLNQNSNPNFKYSSIFIENYSKVKDIYDKTLTALLKSNILLNENFLMDNIEFLVISIVILQKKTLFLMMENITPPRIMKI